MSLFPINSYATASAPAAPAAPAAAAPAAVIARSVPSEQTQAAFIAPVTAVEEIRSTSAEDIKLDQAVEAINRFLKPVASSIEFSVDQDSGRTIVQVIDTDTQDVLRQFPSKEALAISRELDKLQGLLIRDKA